MRKASKTLKITCRGAELMDIDRLEDLQGSLKTLSADNMDKLRGLIEKEYSFPVFVWKRPGQNGVGPVKIIDGHQRVKCLRAMREDGWEIPPIPVDVIEAKTEKGAKEKLLQVLSQYGKMTQKSFEAFLIESGMDLRIGRATLNIPGVYIGELMDNAESQDTLIQLGDAKSARGDLWIMGRHRLLVGDSGSEQDVDRLMAGATVRLLNTDPPYNVNIGPRGAVAQGPGRKRAFISPKQHRFKETHPAQKIQTRARDRELINDHETGEEYVKLLDAWFGNAARVMDPGAAFYIWGGYGNCANYPEALRKAGLKFSQAVIWVKSHPVLNRKDMMGNHEWAFTGHKESEAAFYGWKEGAAHRWFGPTNIADVWEVQKISPNKMLHLTEKPIELARMALKYSSKRGDNVLDLFGGSGPTLIASEELGRNCYMMELDEHYADVIVARWEQFTGEKAKREGRKS